MLNFTVGPVQEDAEVLRIGGEQCPYFRTAEFSEVMLANERMLLELAGAPEGSRAVFLTGSGTAAMEAAVMNVLGFGDCALVVNGGSFGHRFCQLCGIHGISHGEIALRPGKRLTGDDLPEDGNRYTAFLVNVHETSTGVRYDIGLIADYCRRHGLLLIVDAISSFLADDFDMAACGADVMIAGSQKALTCPPGVGLVVLSQRALARVAANDPKCLYLDLKDALANQARGQTPFTPAVGTLLQIHARLKGIHDAGGRQAEVAKVAELAADFRSRINGLPLEVSSESPSNAVTPLRPTNGMSAYDVFLRLKDEHGIWVCPNGGDLKDRIFRVGHLGALTVGDNATLVAALRHVMGGRE